ncbi:MAG: S8 family serine peptidase [Elusimicrobia bacterium]|nr:S8 family serine peptidase [Elusimicrobiota bacterium]
MTLRAAAAIVLALAVPAQAAHVRRVENFIPPEAAAVASATGAPAKAIEVMAEEAMVRFEEGRDLGSVLTGLRNVGIEHVRAVGHGWHYVYLPEGMPTVAGLAFLRAQAGVAEAHPNHVYRLTRLPSDSLISSQYHLSNVNAFAAWEYGVGSNATTEVWVVVMDSGMQADHPDLQGKYVANASRDCSNAVCQATCRTCVPANTTAEPVPACNHGTRVGGVAAAVTDNGTGVAGISWGARLVSVKVLPDSGCTPGCGNVIANPPSCAADDAQMIAGINYTSSLVAAGRRVVLNISLGASGACPAAVQTAITAAYTNGTGVLIVASAGNDGGGVNNPANCLNVIPVGATDANNNIAAFSSRDGGAITAMNERGLVAPGVGLFTTDVNSGYTGGATGTSFSSPLVAGLGALVLAAQPAMTNDNVRATLRGSTTKIGVSSVHGQGVIPQGGIAGAGMANAYSAMRLAVTGSTEFDGTQKAIAFPNPFKVGSHGTVTITVPRSIEGANTTIKVYTPAGQLVKTLKGFTWDGKNESGNPVASGTYVFLVSTENGKSSGRVAVIR